MTSGKWQVASGKTQQLIEEMLAYIDTDAICYRADEDQKLLALQEKIWNSVTEWAEKKFSVKLIITTGIMPHSQPKQLHDALTKEVVKYSDSSIATLYGLTKLGGSLLLALCAMSGAISEKDFISAALLEEDYQAEHWGRVDDAEEHREALTKQIAFYYTMLPSRP